MVNERKIILFKRVLNYGPEEKSNGGLTNKQVGLFLEADDTYTSPSILTEKCFPHCVQLFQLLLSRVVASIAVCSRAHSSWIATISSPWVVVIAAATAAAIIWTTCTGLLIGW